MKIFRSLSELPSGFGPSVVTVGNFDGVHCGHRSVIAELLRRAHQASAASVAITFEPHPSRVLRPAQAPKLITPLEEKLRLLGETGLDVVLVLPFTEALSHTSAETFATDILRDRLQAIEVHEGENFRFGYQAHADTSSLTSLGQKLGFSVKVYHPGLVRGDVISSSRIRSLIAAGDVSMARALLGRPYAIRSTPAHGRGYGTRYAVPTINLAPYPELLPANGVYVTTLRIGDDGPTFEGVTNAGNRPTFGPDSFAVETHLFDFRPTDLDEDTPLTLTFLRYLRPEMKWDSPEALKVQIGKDIRRAQRYLGLRRQFMTKPA